MAFLKKVNPSWAPSEKRNLQVGEIIDFGDYDCTRLVQEGMAVMVDENGNEVAAPGTIFVCPVCFAKEDALDKFTDHVLNAHKKVEEKPEPEEQKEVANKDLPVEEPVEEPKKELSFGEKMAAARAAKKAEREAAAK